MTNHSSRLLEAVYEQIREYLAEGKPIEAIRYYHEISFVPLLDSKNLVFAMQSGKFPETESEGFAAFLSFLESGDICGAAASLCVHRSLSPAEAIDATMRIANRLKVDMTSWSHGTTSLTILESHLAQHIVNERAIELAGGKTCNLPSATKSQSADCQASTVSNPLASPAEVELDARHSGIKRILRRIGRAASITYGLLALLGTLCLGYSYATTPKRMQPIVMREDLPAPEQAIQIQQWASQAIPPTTTWFFPLDRYISLRLEPGLPPAYAYLELPWEKKLALLNASTAATVSAFYKCHWVLWVFYAMAIGLAVWCFKQSNIVAGILMTLLGLIGVPWVTAGFIRLDFENWIWFAPFLLPGIVVLIVAMAELAVIPPLTDWQHERRGFWIGVLVVLMASALLGFAINSGSHLRPNAGVGVLAGLLLVIRHGWGLIKHNSRRLPSNIMPTL